MTIAQYLRKNVSTKDEMSRCKTIIEAVNGLSIRDAQEILQACSNALVLTPVNQKITGFSAED